MKGCDERREFIVTVFVAREWHKDEGGSFTEVVSQKKWVETNEAGEQIAEYEEMNSDMLELTGDVEFEILLINREAETQQLVKLDRLTVRSVTVDNAGTYNFETNEYPKTWDCKCTGFYEFQ